MNEILSTSNFNLRTLEVRDLHQLIADLNFNFRQILQLPGFKGLAGEDGDSIAGPPGSRGSVWIFAHARNFINTYSSVLSPNQVNLSFINAQLTADLATLLATLQVVNLIQNDVVVLPSRDVIQYDSTTNQFFDTGIRFADGLSLTEAEVTVIVNNLLGNLTDADVFTSFTAVAKNYADNSTGLNNELNQNSVLDIGVSGSGSGVVSANHLFIAMKEAMSNNTSQYMMLTGSAKRYNELVQATQMQLTNDYMPGIDDFAGLGVMQNSYNNGIFMGHKDAANFSTWARMFKTENALRFLSDYHPTLEEVARLDLGKAGSTMYSPTNMTLAIRNGTFAINNYSSGVNWFQASGNDITIGNRFLQNFELRTSDYIRVRSSIGNDTAVLSLQAGLLKASLYQPKSDVVVNNAFMLVTHNLFYAYQVANASALNFINIRLAALEAQRVYKQQLVFTSASMNTLTQFGFYKLTYTGTSSVFTNTPDNRLSTGIVTEATMEVHRFVEANVVVANSKVNIKQIFTQQGPFGYPEQYVRTATSINNGATFVFGNWTGIVDANNYRIVAGPMMASTETFGASRTILISHADNAVTSVGDTTVGSLVAVKSIQLDAYGHPQSTNNIVLEDHFYTEPEIDGKLDMIMPIGMITMWAGNPTSIPFGWKLCNGNNGTPNLSGRFLVGYDAADTEYNTFTDPARKGGAKTVTLVEPNIPKHNFGYTGQEGNGFPDGSADWDTTVGNPRSYVRQSQIVNFGGEPSTGLTRAFDKRPPYYMLCFVQYKGPTSTPNTIAPDVINFSGLIDRVGDSTASFTAFFNIVSNSGFSYTTLYAKYKKSSVSTWNTSAIMTATSGSIAVNVFNGTGSYDVQLFIEDGSNVFSSIIRTVTITGT